MQEFDFIAIGGGPGGCVTASRLSETPNTSVALIASGPDRRGVLDDNLAKRDLEIADCKTDEHWRRFICRVNA